MPADPVKAAAGRIGGLTRVARYDPQTLTRDARRGFDARFEREVRAADPDGLLSDIEVSRRAEALKRAHMARLAMRSAQVRRKRGAE